MPDHTSFISYFFQLFPAFAQNAHLLGRMLLSGEPVGVHQLEPVTTSLVVVALVVCTGLTIGTMFRHVPSAVEPETRLSVRTFFEVFITYFYGLVKDVMGDEKARKYFPVIGTSALVIFFSNALGLIPGFLPPTSNLNVTLGCALFVYIFFNYYGFKENGFGYIKHLFGPWLGPLGIPINVLIFLVEFLSVFVIRPATLAIRLMINMAVDHLVVGTFLGLFALLVPLPSMVLGVIVIAVQTLVFCLLSSVYIKLATEHEEH